MTHGLLFGCFNLSINLWNTFWAQMKTHKTKIMNCNDKRKVSLLADGTKGREGERKKSEEDRGKTKRKRWAERQKEG